MSEKGRFIDLKDLKQPESFIEQYVALRNSYTELLLTSPVNLAETKEWLKKDDIEIRGFVEDNALLGAVILYLDRNGEVAFFAGEKGKGIGSKLLVLIEDTARRKKLQLIWSWVLKENHIAQRVFEKNGFKKEGETIREYRGMPRQGIEYKKILE